MTRLCNMTSGNSSDPFWVCVRKGLWAVCWSVLLCVRCIMLQGDSHTHHTHECSWAVCWSVRPCMLCIVLQCDSHICHIHKGSWARSHRRANRSGRRRAIVRGPWFLRGYVYIVMSHVYQLSQTSIYERERIIGVKSSWAMVIKGICIFSQITCVWVISSIPHGGHQTQNIWISGLDSFPVHSFEWRELPFTLVQTCLNFWGIPWNFVRKLRGLSENLFQLLAVVIISSQISSARGIWENEWFVKSSWAIVLVKVELMLIVPEWQYAGVREEYIYMYIQTHMWTETQQSFDGEIFSCAWCLWYIYR